ncbi:MAG TPA: dUTP diphosphatase [Candidatus Magasanikbacteria bacterium]|nr:MAG: hypothetical protein A3I74_01630 [Candidatus Magasanikbacteria bacterium RIFCSPLOWO2_02_FULL_47_16]OGH79857.1 MAG: hypothetical protein A3C10_00130 [Candidatus Magasanikbacteria bacterium RIFCSPHIGHO2_02_FULL_48_18]OGH82097.1 MAG: hypothetical protein A3G08_04345 [Candidatus Magasanikbacteria bacterium RIFCSPLOWO2_12_FULL_47_9b]HAZ28885.1 dUTP diphosphatase [Candidatus Magasanikbacteria bacterium]
MRIHIKKLKSDAIIPSYGHPGDIGLDLYSLEDYTLQPGERHVFFHGFAMEFPEGYGAIVKDKGGPSGKFGVATIGGVFDAGYRGEYNSCLINLGDEPFPVKKGQKIAQLIVIPVVIATFEEVDELSDSARGDGKYGSTGIFHNSSVGYEALS